MKRDRMKFEHIEFDSPYETLRPCRSRIVAGVVMIAALAVVTYLLSG